MSEEVIEVKPEVIDAPARRTAIDGLVERAVRLEDAIKRGDTYCPREITSAADYKQSKTERAALNQEIKAIKDERARLFRPLKNQEKRVTEALAPADDVQKEYGRRGAEWERLTIDSRTQEVAAWYAETQGDVAQLVPFDVLWRRYAAEGKWDKYSTNLVAEEEDVARRVEGIERDLDTIHGYGFEPQDEENVKDAYLRTLDLSGAIREAEEARKRRERMAEVERQRAERMAQAERMAASVSETPESGPMAEDATKCPADAAKHEISASQARSVASSADAHERILGDVAEAVAAPDPGDEVPPIAFVAYVTEAQRDKLVAFCRQLGIGGFTRPTHGRRLHFERR